MLAHYTALIGPHHLDYYLGYFRRADERGYAPIAWHWPAFLLGPFWLLWRRQYLWAAGTFSISMVFAVVAGAVQRSSGEDAALIVNFALVTGWGIYLGLYGNAIYYRWAKRLIAAAQAAEPRNEANQRTLLIQAGGINRHLPLILTAVFILLTLLASNVTPPNQLS